MSPPGKSQSGCQVAPPSPVNQPSTGNAAATITTTKTIEIEFIFANWKNIELGSIGHKTKHLTFESSVDTHSRIYLRDESSCL